MSYTINRDGHQYGPYTREQFRQHVDQGAILATDLVWLEDRQCWAPVRELGVVPPPAPPAARPRSSNRITMYCLIAIWLAWFFLPFVSLGYSFFEVTSWTAWNVTSSSSLTGILGLVAIALPIFAMRTGSRFMKYLHLAPAIFLLVTAFMTNMLFGQVAQAVNGLVEGSPVLQWIASVGLQAAAHAVSFDSGAYVLAVASLALGVQAFERTSVQPG